MGTVDSPAPGDVLFGKTRRALLRLLFTRPDESFHLRQIVRLADAGVGAVQRELKQLTAAGLLRQEQRGNQLLYSANKDSPLYPEIQSLVIKTAGLADLLRQALLPLASRIRCAFIFGSFARGAYHKDSDIDLMVVGNVPFVEISRAISEPQRRLARDINPNAYPPAELAEKLATGHHFVSQVLAGPKLFLLGDEDELRRVAEARLDSATRHQRQRNRGNSQGHKSRPKHQRQH